MLRAYVGIADGDGLLALLPDRMFDPELPHHDSKRVWFWVTAADDDICQVQTELNDGDRTRALQTLDALAVDLMPLPGIGTG